jgi:hypothetical protein
VTKLKYSGITLTDQNFMNEKIKSRLNLGNACYHSFVFLPAVLEFNGMKWAGHVACVGEERKVYWVLVGKPEGKRPLGRSRH